MRNISAIVIVFLITFLTIEGAIAEDPQDREIILLETHDIHILTLSSEVFIIDCVEGEILSGEFTVTGDGDLYQGDQRKYDLWVGWGHGVDFFVFNYENYIAWEDGEEATPFYEQKDAISLSWSINIDSTGFWYVVYVNDSPNYVKKVEGSINHTSDVDDVTNFIVVSITGTLILVVLLLVWKSKMS